MFSDHRQHFKEYGGSQINVFQDQKLVDQYIQLTAAMAPCELTNL